jgi:lipopolysaccharide/colanic/teichoic acid biosynthesis glycosyltransferase
MGSRKNGPCLPGRRAKRWLDILGASVGLLLLAPLLLLVSLGVAACMGSPVLFRQPRAGKDGVPFELFKFRTMRNARDASGNLLEDAQRLTPLGDFLRRASLDELPQLYNVLRGEMSLVGPRPLLLEYVPLYNDQQRRRLEMLPGITGWAQINGRNALSWEEKFRLDVWYVENWSFWLDCKILWKTLGRVFRPSGISHEGHATMEKFRGTSPDQEKSS